MKVNFIDNAYVKGDDKVIKLDEVKVLLAQPDKPKSEVRYVQLLE